MRYLEVAKKAAKEAGRIHKKYFRKGVEAKAKSVSYDLLTVADTESEKAAVSLIKRYFPQHNFLAEEFIYNKTDSGYTWIIDPLDGTNNFANGIPIFCSSVALAHKAKVLAAAVYDALRNELFYAQEGKGAFLNGRRISVSKAKSIPQALLITGFYYDRGKNMVETLEAIKRFHFAHCVGVRRFGAAALDLCYVACGRATGFWEFELNPWDFAAAKLIIEEAGGKMTGRHSEKIPLFNKHFIVASNKKIHKLMLDIIESRRPKVR